MKAWSQSFSKLLYVLIITVLLISVVSGCGLSSSPSTTKETTDLDDLSADAVVGFRQAITADTQHLNIISGGLKKLHSSSNPELILGKVLGAIEASTYAKSYEYKRLDENINIPVEVKRELVGPGLLTTLNRTYDVLEHVNQNILIPYSESLTTKQELSANQEKAVAKSEELMQQLAEGYRRLSQSEENTREQEQQIIKDITKIQQQLITIYFPTEVSQ